MTSLILTACGGADSPASQPAAISGAAAGQPLFALNCGECHGQDGTGTDEAPGIGGHDAEEVIEQVRNPVGDMEAIASEALSDADLQLIAEFVASLPGEEAHPEISPSEEERVHLVAAYEAIEDYEDMDREAAINHLGQALAIATDEAAIAIYEELLEAVETGKSGTTRHELKELLGLEEGH
ncbi:MAG: c-type cytochrome [Chloroflexi bacterium]|nr:c-type cytochrome [Chloroflexota bacterium]